MKKLIALRKEKKSKKPVFRPQDSWKRKLLPKSWRRPKGLHSKMRLKFKGNPKLPSQGYRSPKKVRGMHGSGLTTVLVRSANQLEGLKSEGIIIASALGSKKRIEIIKKAAEKKIKVVNLDAEEYLKKKEKAAQPKKKEEPKQETKAKPSEKKSEKSKATEEEKRKEEKKEIEKIITKRH